MKAHLSKIAALSTTAITILLAKHALPPEYAAYAIAVLGILQAFLPKVQQSSSDVKIADAAVAENKSAQKEFKG